MGALIGALSASGYKSSEIQSIAEDARLIDLIDIDVKKGGIKGKRIVKFLEKYLSDTTFSELNIPLKIVATNIDTGEKVVFTEGRIVDAVRASISIP
ncbi:MAG: patatin-like phospholipase family protein [Patescibacteria group bacterium]